MGFFGSHLCNSCRSVHVIVVYDKYGEGGGKEEGFLPVLN